MEADLQGQAALEHERHRALSNVLGDELRCAGLLEAADVRTVRGHHRVQGGTAGEETLLNRSEMGWSVAL